MVKESINNKLTKSNFIKDWYSNIGRLEKNIAIVDDKLDKSISFLELEILSGKVFAYLKKENISTEDVVMICLPRNYWAIACILGVLKSGAAFTILEDDYPKDRISYIRKDSNCKLIIDKNVWNDIVNLDYEKGFISHDVHDAAFIIYTSGTTGSPKGIIHEYGNIEIDAISGKTGRVDVNTAYALISPLNFIASIKIILTMIIDCCTLHLMSYDTSKNLNKLKKYFYINKINISFLTPSMLRIIGDNLGPSMKYVFTGSEPANGVYINGPKLINTYSMSECAFTVSQFEIDKKYDICPVGKPNLDFINIQILDENGKNVKDGEVGEIVFENPFMRGYINLPNETKKAIRGGLFHTGDLGKILPDGNLVLVGRSTDTIKISGNRIEPAEIENHVNKVLNLSNSIAKGFEDNGQSYICLYYQDNIFVDEKKLRKKLENVLPAYMIPSYFIHIDKWPLLPNGKINKKLLLPPNNRYSSTKYVAPKTEIQKVICKAISKVLDIDKVGINDNFIKLGGDSLAAIQVASEISNYNISSLDLLKNDSIKNICLNISKKRKATIDNKYNKNSGCPLPANALAMYLDAQVNNKYSAYNINGKFPIRGYSKDQIVSCLKELFDYHFILKGRIGDKNGEPWMLFDSEVDFKYHKVLSKKAIDNFYNESFDLSKCLSRIKIVGSDKKFDIFYCFHHIIFDANSVDVFINDLQNLLNGEPLNYDFGCLDLSALDETAQSGDMLKDAEHYFDKTLSETDDCYSFVESLDNDNTDKRLLYELDCDLSSIKNFCEDIASSRGSFFTSSFAYIMSKFTGGSKAQFNVVINAREWISKSDSIGLFACMTPVLFDCSIKSKSKYFQSASRVFYNAVKYSYYPENDLENKFSLNSGIIFQYLPLFINYDELKNQKKGNIVIKDLANGAMYDFMMYVVETSDRLYLDIQFSNKYDVDFVQSLAIAFNKFLKQVCYVDELSEINYTPNKDIDLYNTRNCTYQKYVFNDLIEAFNYHVKKSPNNVCVCDDLRSYSYKEVDYITNYIANELTDMGLKKGDVVGVIVDRGVWYALCTIACLKAAVVYVPLDEKLPEDRIRTIFNTAKIKGFLYSKKYEKAISYCKIKFTCEDNLLPSMISSKSVYKSVKVDKEFPAHIIFTSGTTGIPKGVVCKRLGMINNPEWCSKRFGLNKNDCYGWYASYGFTAHLNCFSTIVVGGSINIVPDNIRLDIQKLSKYYDVHNITVGFLPSSIMYQFFSYGKNTSLKHAIRGGERAREFSYEGNCEIIDVYGSSETSAAALQVDRQYQISNNRNSMGVPVPNTHAYILDSEMRRLPVGAIGQLYISGNQVAKGYLNLNEETNKTFIDNLFISNWDKSETMVATGDYAYYSSDGNICNAGRRDNMFKIRGNRVELADVESCISELGSVKETVVLGLKKDGENYLAAFITPKTSKSKSGLEEEVKSYVRKRKPNYMVPSYVVVMDKLPLNANGKIDKNKLKNIKLEKTSTEYVEPRNNEEKVLCDIFAKVLNIEKVGINDDFISLGGDSLSAVKVINLLNDSGINSLTASDLLSLGVVKTIASTLNINTDTDNLYQYDNTNVYKITEMQLSTLLDEQSRNKSDAYIFSDSFSLGSKYKKQNVINSIKKLIELHPVLKSRIEFNGSDYILSCTNSIDIKYSKNASDEEVHKFLNEPFDIYGNLCRFLIVENPDEFVIHYSIHHIISDLTSIAIIEEDIFGLLENENVCADDGIFKLASFDEKIDTSSLHNEAKAYFDNMLENVDECNELISEGSNNKQGLLIKKFSIDGTLLDNFIKSRHISKGSFFTSIFAYVYSRYTGSDKVQFCITSNGRDRYNADNSIGLFARTSPVIFNCSDDKIENYFKNSAEIFYKVNKYNFYSFRRLVGDYDINGDIVFQYIPSMNDFFMRKLSQGTGSLKNCHITLDSSDTIDDLLMYVIEDNGKFNLCIIHSDKFSFNLIDSFAESYISITNEVFKKERLSEINYVSKKDMKLLEKINNTGLDIPYKDFIEVFEKHVAEQPDKICVASGDTKISYAQVDKFSNHLCNIFKEHKLSQGDTVSFCVERGCKYIVCIIACLKYGLIYVPLDNNLPNKRLSDMYEISMSKYLIADDENISVLPSAKVIKYIESESDFVRPKKYKSNVSGLVFTSGTTGKPKGVKITRLGLLNVTAWYNDCFGFKQNEKYGFCTSVGFVIHLNMFYAIYGGATVNIVPDDVRYDMSKLNSYFKKYSITHTFLTSRVTQEFFNSQKDTNIEYCQKGGEQLKEFSYEGDSSIFEGYGASETNAITMYCPQKLRTDPSDIGLPISNTKAYILDKNKNIVPFGALGELHISGYPISDGYFNDEELTQEKFNNGMYATGDYAYISFDGHVVYVGRKDNMVKINGNRLEPTEVEYCIKTIKGVSNANVQPVKVVDGYKIVAYVVADNKVSDNSIINYVAEHKPSFMVPSKIIRLKKIPLNANGKIDKKSLPKVNLEIKNTKYCKPRNKEEKLLCSAFEKVLGVDKIGIDDDFVALGGDSLSAIKVSSCVPSLELITADILKYRSVRNIMDTTDNIKFSTKNKYTFDTGIPLSPIQLAMYLDSYTNDKFDAYHIYGNTDLSGYSKEKITEGINKLISAHPILRSKIEYKDKDIWLYFNGNVEIKYIENFNESDLDKFYKKEFDFSTGLFRILLYGRDNYLKLAFCCSHIIFDAFSTEIFFKDLFNILNGEKIDIDDGCLKYVEFTEWAEESKLIKNAEDYFDKSLQDSEASSFFAESTPRNEKSRRVVMKLDCDVKNIESYIRKNSISKGSFFTSCFAYLASNFSGSDKFQFNIIANGRNLINIKNSIGLYANSVPVCYDCSIEDADNFFKTGSEIFLNSLKYSYYPERELLRKYQINSQYVFQYLPLSDKYKEFHLINNGQVEEINIKDNLIYDFMMYVIETEDGLIVDIKFSNKFSVEMVRRFAMSFNLLLSNIFNVDKLSDANYTPNQDIELYDKVNKTYQKHNFNDLIDAFNYHVKVNPNNICVRDINNSFTYKEVDYITNFLANLIKDNDFGKGDIIGVLVNRSVWYVLCTVACLKAGVVYVPFDEKLPKERIRSVYEVANIKGFLFTNEFKDKISYCNNNIQCNDEDINRIISSKASFKPINVDRDFPAHIIFTSGTTGTPKGVVCKRLGMINNPEWCSRHFNLTSKDSYGWYTSYGFTAHLNCFTAFISGGSINIVPDEIRLDIQKLSEYYNDNNITVGFLPSSIMNQFFSFGTNSSLKHAIRGGERAREFEYDGDCEIIDVYGSSETSAAALQVERLYQIEVNRNSMGTPIPNTHAYILDSKMRRVPIGAIGQLYISGNQVAKGYLNNKEATESTFKENIFKSKFDNCDVMVATGDYAYYNEDCNICNAGRRDNMFKIRGNRIELADIETCILELSYIKEAVVLGKKNGNNNYLVAYVSLNNKDNETSIVEDVKNHIKKYKPSYMVPAFIIALDKLPLSANGKIDKKALLEIAEVDEKRVYEAPTNKIEKSICAAFESVFEIANVGINDDFYMLGGDSMMAVMVSQLLVDLNISASDILANSTPKNIAMKCSQQSIVDSLGIDLDKYTNNK